jgi:hypothetical protein
VYQPIERWTIRSLRALIPNTSAANWRRVFLPELLAQRVLVKRGKGWLGRRNEIEAALLNSPIPLPASVGAAQ